MYIKKDIKRNILLLFVFFVGFCSCSKGNLNNDNKSNKALESLSEKGFNPDYEINLSNPVISRNFYALYQLELHKKDLGDLFDNQYLDDLLHNKMNNFKNTLLKGDATIESIGKSLYFSEKDIEMILDQMDKMADNPALQSIIDNNLRPSGFYQIYEELPNSSFLKYSMKECLKGINQIIDVYTQGKIPLDPVSDLGLYHKSKSDYKSNYIDTLKKYSTELNSKLNDSDFFFQPSLDFALLLLKINHREEAGSFEPLKDGENRISSGYLKAVEWTDFKYNCIVVLGDSPKSSDDAPNLSNHAKEKVEEAVNLFKNKIAPMIIITGANMYPNLTPYYEAVEMKRYMMDTYHVYEKYILVDPHARHTTTNIRNACRIIFRYGIPYHQSKFLILGGKWQINDMVSGTFSENFKETYGYVPVSFGEKISATTIEFDEPRLDCLTSQPSIDPLDP